MAVNARPPIRYWDAAVEQGTRESLEGIQLRATNDLFGRVMATNRFHSRRLREFGWTGGPLRTIHHLRDLPLMSKRDVLDSIAQDAPFGTQLGVDVHEIREIVMSSGTTGGTREVMCLTAEDLDFAAAVTAMDQTWKGGSPGDRALYCVNLGVTTGPLIVVAGWQKMGLVPLRTGPYSTEERIDLMLRYSPSVLHFSRTYAPRFMDACRERNIDPHRDLPSLECVRTTGGTYDQAFVTEIESFFGAPLHETFGSTQSIHPTAGTCEDVYGRELAQRVMHLHEHALLIEVLDPQSLEPTEEGQVGEVVLTTIRRHATPLIRYRTGDMVRIGPAGCGCGRPFRTIAAGCIFRTDDLLRIKNTNVWLHDLETTVRDTASVRDFLLELSVGEGGHERALLRVELQSPSDDHSDVARQIRNHLRDRYHVGFDVVVVATGTLAVDQVKNRRCIDRRNLTSAVS